MFPNLRVITIAKTPYFYQKTLAVAGLALALLTSSCTANQTKANTKERPRLTGTAPQSMGTPISIQDIPPINEVKIMNPQEQIFFSRQDLAERLELELKAVKLSGARSVTWRSGALGCPMPGKLYTQALVPGVLITLSAGNTDYRYHAKLGGTPFHCPDGRAELYGTDPKDI